jgi:hypothetical protein
MPSGVGIAHKIPCYKDVMPPASILNDRIFIMSQGRNKGTRVYEEYVWNDLHHFSKAEKPKVLIPIAMVTSMQL